MQHALPIADKVLKKNKRKTAAFLNRTFGTGPIMRTLKYWLFIAIVIVVIVCVLFRLCERYLEYRQDTKSEPKKSA